MTLDQSIWLWFWILLGFVIGILLLVGLFEWLDYLDRKRAVQKFDLFIQKMKYFE
jgi:Na+/H+-dicarboxylate symporter